MEDRSSVVKEYLDRILNERVQQTRLSAMRRVCATQSCFIDLEGRFSGRKTICVHCGAFIRRYPEFRFRERKEVNENAFSLVLYWDLGTEVARPAFSGMDVIIFEGGLISTISRFVDRAAF